jgi:hypothetical protein
LIMLSLCMQKEERENLFLRKVQISIFTWFYQGQIKTLSTFVEYFSPSPTSF